MHNRLLESSDSNEERKPVEALHHRYRAGALFSVEMFCTHEQSTSHFILSHFDTYQLLFRLSDML